MFSSEDVWLAIALPFTFVATRIRYAAAALGNVAFALCKGSRGHKLKLSNIRDMASLGLASYASGSESEDDAPAPDSITVDETRVPLSAEDVRRISERISNPASSSQPDFGARLVSASRKKKRGGKLKLPLFQKPLDLAYGSDSDDPVRF